MKYVRHFVLTGLFTAIISTLGFAQAYVEVDPLAYALKGYSLHTGYFFSGMKADVGVFGIQVPESFHGNKDFSVNMRGLGWKLHYLGNSTAGWFAGIGGGYTTTKYSINNESTSKDRFSLGVEGGYRFEFESTGLYVQPWLGIDHAFGEKNVIVNGKKFNEGEISFFPTIHLGWKF